MTPTDDVPELSACHNAPVVLCEGTIWDVPGGKPGHTYYYGCTKCKQACDLATSSSKLQQGGFTNTLEEIYDRMEDYTIFHDRNDGDFRSPGDTYLSWSEAKQAILKAHQEAIEAEVEASLEMLKKELRDYHDKFPDADYNDVIGYVVGFQYRPKKAGGK